jgi:hypothetical protein
VLFTLILIVLRWALVFEARAGFAKDTKIMVSKLEIILGLHPVTGQLCVAGHVLVFLEKLRGIAPAALIAAASATTSAETLRTLTPTTATAAVLAIVHQA